ncbi:MAG TPA: aromatic hydrocarbon degradation protein [Chitinophagaceae bacterium]|nr:aromatic hydrocarbon degradation protein [Chitinophagaceae bacterium]
MTKYFLSILTLCPVLSVLGQEPADALRYSWYSPSGTARQQAIGGAMTSLGGEISAAFVNPAGLGLYKTGDFVFTPGFQSLRNRSSFFDRSETATEAVLAFGTTGIVLGGSSGRSGTRLRSGALSLAVNQTANFRSRILYRGINSSSSYSQKFLEEIRDDRDANSVAGNYPFGPSLAFNTYWIDTVAGGTAGNFSFQTRAPIATGLIQENDLLHKGGIAELTLAGAANYDDKLFVGGAFGVPFLHYVKEGKFTEADVTANSDNKFDFASISEYLVTEGAGFNIKAGLIYRPAQQWRLGIALHSPTWFLLTDRYNASVTTHTEGYRGLLTQSSTLFTNNQDAEFRYTLLTPYRVLLSASYVLREIEDVKKQKGFLTADIEYVNHRASAYHTDPDADNSQDTREYLRALNRAINASYKGSFNFRAGGELKFTTVMVRLGAGWMGNPYRASYGAKGSRLQLTGGLGYRHRGVFVDIAYVHTSGKDVHFPYRLASGTHPSAQVRQTGANILLTIGFKI